MNSQQVSKKYIRLAAKSVMILMLLLLVGCNARSGREGAQVGQAVPPTAVQSEGAVGTILPASPAAGNDKDNDNDNDNDNDKEASGGAQASGAGGDDDVPARAAPNILLIIADDMGIDASPCYDVGAEKPNMPNLERLCEEGIVFEQVWATPMCSSTRATLLTGRYGLRTGIGAAVGAQTRNGGIGLEEVSIQRFLAENAAVDYATAVIGKWHLADQSNGFLENPTMMGIDHYAGLLAGTHDDYSSWSRTENGVTEVVNGYSTTLFTDDAIAWVTQQQQPWFLWLAYTAPHEPFHLPPEGLHQHPELSGGPGHIRRNPQPYYLAMMEALDHEMGRLIDALPADERQNTVMMFLGDNGTPRRVIQAPYEANQAKASIFEGGVHVPLVVAGAGVSRQGEREAALINTTDFFATIAELAGVPIVAYEDSISFTHLLSQPAPHNRSVAYSEFFGSNKQADRHGWTIRDHRFKLIKLENGNRLFYDLLADPAEQTNLLRSEMDETATQHLAELEALATQLRHNPPAE